jgi:circadian clock protein KaiC
VSEPVIVQRLATGVAGLDEIIGGGLPELSFNLIAGPPGAGKTTMAHQIMFAAASAARPALYMTVLGEPPLKMLRYQQQFSFFDPSKIGSCVRFLHLGSEALDQGLESVLTSIVREVEATNPKLVFVDSFRSVVYKSQAAGPLELQSFVQRLALHLTGWEATTFLIGEYEEHERDCNPLFTVADGVLWLSQALSRNSTVRKIQVLKMRGQEQIPGLHTLKIANSGLRIYPRLPTPVRPVASPIAKRPRRSTGVSGLDRMLGDGVPSGYSVMVVGPSGSGKTSLVTEFIRDGINRGEPGVIAVFERCPEEYLTTARGAEQLSSHIQQGLLKMVSVRPLDLSVEETMEEIAVAVQSIGAKRLVIDSLSGLELALGPDFRDDFRESAYRMIGALMQLGVTVMMTAEIVESYTELRFSGHGISFLTDGIILQRYVELGGALRRVMCIVKMRGCAHSSAFHFYEIGDKGIALGESLADYEGALGGTLRLTSQPRTETK